jgi:tRNA A58 N-methylase Trm61
MRLYGKIHADRKGGPRVLHWPQGETDMADNKFTGIQLDVKDEDELVITIETSNGTTLTFSATVDQVEDIMDTLADAFEEVDDEDLAEEDDSKA